MKLDVLRTLHKNEGMQDWKTYKYITVISICVVLSVFLSIWY